MSWSLSLSKGPRQSFFIMKRLRFLILTLLIPLLFTSCLADILNEKFNYTVPFTITYNSDYGSAPARKKVQPGTELSSQDLPSLSDESWIFVGWYLDRYFQTQAQEGTIVNSNITLYALWRSDYVNVSYSSEYGLSTENDMPYGNLDTSASITLAYGTRFTSETLPQLFYPYSQAYVFKGWFYDSKYTRPAYEGDEIIYNTTLYAKWENYSYIVKYHLLDVENTGSEFLVNENLTEYYNSNPGNNAPPLSQKDASNSAYEHFENIHFKTDYENNYDYTVINFYYYNTEIKLQSFSTLYNSLPEDYYYQINYKVKVLDPDGLNDITYITSILSSQNNPKIFDLDLTACNFESIPDYAFYYEDQLYRIVLPCGLQTIGQYAFYQCSHLNKVYLPLSLTTIKEYAFNIDTFFIVFYEGSEEYKENNMTIEEGNSSIDHLTNSIYENSLWYNWNYNQTWEGNRH